MNFFQIAHSGYNHWLAFLACLFLILLANMIGNLPLFAVLSAHEISNEDMASSLFQSGVDKNLMLLLLVIPFVCGLITLILYVRRVHLRKAMSLVTARDRMDWSRLGIAFVLWFCANLLIELFHHTQAPELYEFRGISTSYLALMAVAIFFLPLQVGFEELLFRGYLLQGLGLISTNIQEGSRRFGSQISRMFSWFSIPLVPICLSSMAFSMVHLANPEVMKYGVAVMLPYYVGIGIILAIITVMDDGLEIPLGIHLATNIYLATIVSYDSAALQTDALFHSSREVVMQSIYTFLIFSALFTWFLSWLYKWPSWSKLWTPVVWRNPVISLA